MSAKIPYAVWKTLTQEQRDALSKRAARPRAARAQSAPRAARASGTNWADATNTLIKYAVPVAGAIAAANYAPNLKIAGFGDYAPMTTKPKSNSFMREIMAHGPPAIHNTSQRTFIVRHREYLGDVTTGATSAFNINHYPINPGLPATFPWLAQIAQNFEQYRIRGMVFEFKSTSADALNSTNTALGTVVMATEYNSDSDPFATKQQMENHEFANSCRQSCSMLHAIECKPSQTSISELYVRRGDPASGQDLRLYDLGRFSIATVGQQGASVNIGELWCSYEVELLKPQIPDESSVSATDHVWSNTAVSTSAPFGTTRTIQRNGLGCSYTSTVISFPDDVATGDYLLTLFYFGTGGAAACTFPQIALSGATALQVFANGAANGLPVNTVSSISTASAYIINVTSLGATITFTGGTLPSGTVQYDLVLSRISPA